MPSKLQFYSALADRTLDSLTAKRGNWTRFLNSAAWLYKYPFHDQMMIYAQRPDATACAELEMWNERFDRWVRRGSKGIALIDDSGSYPRLKYVFDVSDTEPSQFRAKPVKLWEARQEHKATVLTELAKNYEDIDTGGTLADAFHNIAKQLAREYYDDNYREILYHTENSALEPSALYDYDGRILEGITDDTALRAAFEKALANSVAYTVMARCGLDPAEYFDEEDFQVVIDMNTPDMANTLGVASSGLTEQVLRDIEITIRKYERVKNAERSENSHERNTNPDPHPSRGLSSARPDTQRAAERTDGAARQIRPDEKSVPQRLPADNLQQASSVGEPIPTSEGSGGRGGGEIVAGDSRIDAEKHLARQSERPDGLDGGDERAESPSGGTGLERTDLQLDASEAPPDEGGVLASDKKPSPAFSQLGKSSIEKLLSASSITMDEVDSILRDGGNYDNHKLVIAPFNSRSALRVAAHFAKGPDDNAAFLKREYLIGRYGRSFTESGKGFDFGNHRVSAWFTVDGIELAIGNTAKNNSRRITIPWEDAAARVYELMHDGLYISASAFDAVLDNERGELADRLWFFYRDDMSEIPEDFKGESGGHPGDHAHIKSLLENEHECQRILSRLETDVEAWKNSTDRRSWDNPERLLGEMRDAMRPPLMTPNNDFEPVHSFSYFITQDEIDAVITCGGSYYEGRLRLLSFFLGSHDYKEKLAFIKREYGHGGGTWSQTDGWQNAEPSKGLTITRGGISKGDAVVNLKWNAVLKRTEQLIESGQYATRADLDYIPRYERLMLARNINGFYYSLPDEYERPFPGKTGIYVNEYRNDDGEKTLDFHYPREAEWQAIRDFLDDPERVDAVLEQMSHIFENTSTDDRYYETRKLGFEALIAFREGTYSLFPGIENLPDPETAATRHIVPPETPRREMIEDLRESPQAGFLTGAPRRAEQMSLFDVGPFPELLSVNEQRTRIGRALQEEAQQAMRETGREAEAQAPAFSIDVNSDTLLPDISDENRARIMEQFTANPRSREAVSLIREIYGDLLDIPLPQAVKRITELVKVGAFTATRDPYNLFDMVRDELSGRGWSVSGELIEDGINEYNVVVGGGGKGSFQDVADFDAIKQAVYDKIISDELYSYHLRFAESRGALRNPLNIALEKVIAEMRPDVPDGYFNDDRADELFDFIYRESWAQRPKPETAATEPPVPIEALDDGIEPDVATQDTPAYNLGDTFYMDDGKPYIVHWTGSVHEIGYHSPDTPYIGKLMEKADFEDLLQSNPLNRHFFQNEGFTEITDPGEIAEIEPGFVDNMPKPESAHVDAMRFNYRITDDRLGEGGAKTKFRANIKALQTLKDIEFDNRIAAPEEQETLARYVGWGSIQQAFDPDNKDWANEYLELSALLTPQEWESARASTLNAHYTSPVVIKAIYETVERLGFRSGNILEPACGVGNFLGLLPDSMQGSKLYGVELDSVTARIAKQLYPGADIRETGFEKTQYSDAFFDLAIGNVPFGGFGVVDKRYKTNFKIHDYFFQKSLDKVRPGGIVAFITSKGTLDKQNPEARKYIAQRAELLGAVRLPNNAFLKNAGTEATTDIIFLQKRGRPLDITPEWVHLGMTGDGLSVNRYFLDNPEMMLGIMSNESGHRMYGNENATTCVPIPGADLAKQLKTALSCIEGEYKVDELDDLDGVDNNAIPADPNVKNFSYTVSDSRVYFRENSLMYPVELPAMTENRIRGMIKLRECVNLLVELQLHEHDDSEIKAQQSVLNTLYDGFVAEFGLISSKANSRAFNADSAYYLLSSLEVIDEDGELERKADMFTKRTIKQKTVVTHCDTATDALAVSLGEKARVDMEYMSSLTGKDEAALFEELRGVIFLDLHSGGDLDSYTYRTADEFLSGNVREKLKKYQDAFDVIPDDYRHYAAFRDNVEALRAIQPKDLEAGEIGVRLGSTWIGPNYVQEFMYELFGTSYYNKQLYQIKYHAYTGEWQVTGKNRAQFSDINATVTYGTQRMNAYQILDDTLNLRDVRVYDNKEDADGKERRVLNKKETMLAQQKQELIKQKFSDWIWSDPERRHTLVRQYNDLFNAVRLRDYNGSHITFDGMNPEIKLSKHQVDGVARHIYGGNALYAHVVGSGKTFTMIASAMESKRLGLCQKNLFAVPNHLTEQWASEFMRLYPSANVLVATKKDFEMRSRKKFCAKIATGEYDAVIIGHTQLEKIPMSRERQERQIREQISEIEEGIREIQRSRDERFSIKQFMKTKRGLENRLITLLESKKRDDVVTYEQLGVDRLYVDEAHSFKNLFIYTKMRNVAGLSTSEAQKSSDLFMKCRYMDELTGNKGVVFASGTPISNSISEMYTMQRYLQYDTICAKNLSHFDAWASIFGETVTSIELAPEGVEC